jgi:hypothetical protein
MSARLAARGVRRACQAPRRGSESRQLRFVPGLFALSTELSRFRSAADPAPRWAVHHRPPPAADSTRNFRKMRIRIARRRFVPVLFSLSLDPLPNGTRGRLGNSQSFRGEAGPRALDSAAGAG